MTRRSVDISKAQNRFSELLDCVKAGETIGITRHGEPIALLKPAHEERPSARQAIVRLRKLRAGSRLKGLSIKQLRDEGRP